MSMVDRMGKIRQIFVCFGLLLITKSVLTDHAVLKTQSSYGKVKDYCIMFNPDFQSLNSTLIDSTPFELKDHSTSVYCNKSQLPSPGPDDPSQNVIVVARGECTFSVKAALAQNQGYAGIIILVDSLFIPSANNDTDYSTIHIIVATIVSSDYDQIQENDAGKTVVIYQPPLRSGFDPATIIIFLMAVLCIVVGGIWSGRERIKRSQKKTIRKTVSDVESGKNKDKDDEDDGDSNMFLTMTTVAMFVVMASIFLVLLFFFYDYLVYVVIGLFCLASSSGLYSCLSVLLNYIPNNKRLPELKTCCGTFHPMYKELVLFLLCFGLAIFWVIQRHENYAWVIQNILGIAFCVNLFRQLYAPNLKVCLVLMMALFVYDIFFVFITPYFTANKESIMIKAATGGNSKTGEQIPMLLKVPRLAPSPYNACPGVSYAMLGFGDIIIPGLLLCYNYFIDLKVESKGIYFISSVIGYGVGLVLAFLASFLMDSGQPALLYLNPCVLIPTFVIAGYRKEVGLLWRSYSDKDLKKNEDFNPRNGRISPVRRRESDESSSSSNDEH